MSKPNDTCRYELSEGQLNAASGGWPSSVSGGWGWSTSGSGVGLGIRGETLDDYHRDWVSVGPY